MAEPNSPRRRFRWPSRKWTAFTLLVALLAVWALGDVIPEFPPLWIALPLAVGVLWFLPRTRCGRWVTKRWRTAMVHRRMRIAFRVAAILVATIVIGGFPFWKHFIATQLVWSTGGVLQYEGGPKIEGVFGRSEYFRERSGETWRRRFFGPVVALRMNPTKMPFSLWWLTSFPELTYLDANGVTDREMKYLPSFPKLQTLTLQAEGNLDSGMHHFTALPELNNLRINGPRSVSDDALTNLAKLPKLRTAWLESGLITDAGLANLAPAKIGYLVLTTRQITDAGLQQLKALPLGWLSVESPPITNDGILAIHRAIPGLETNPPRQPVDEQEAALVEQIAALGGHSELNDNGRVGGVVFLATFFVEGEEVWEGEFVGGEEHHLTDAEAEILAKLPEIPTLSIASREFTDQGMRHLFGATELEIASFRRSPIDGSGLAHLPKPSKISELDLALCRMDGENLRHLVGMTELESLDLAGSRVGDAGLTALPPLPKLHTLVLEDCRLTNAELGRLAQFPMLDTLILSENADITDDVVEVLSQLKGLQFLSLYDTGVTSAGAERLQAALPDCEVVAGGEDDAAPDDATNMELESE